jgi:hypothetical protein
MKIPPLQKKIVFGIMNVVGYLPKILKAWLFPEPEPVP